MIADVLTKTYLQSSCRCFPHITNIACQTIIKELKENPHYPIHSSSLDPEKWEELEKYASALASDPVGIARTIVGACWKSGQRCAELKLTIEVGNEQEWWEHLPVLQLLRDIET
jgi:hypothetical protein